MRDQYISQCICVYETIRMCIRIRCGGITSRDEDDVDSTIFDFKNHIAALSIHSKPQNTIYDTIHIHIRM